MSASQSTTHPIRRIRVLIYCRVSTDEQADYGTSLENQDAECRAYAAARDWEVVEVFTDDYTGLTLDRPDMNRMREMIARHAADIVLVHKVDRLSRDQADPAILWKDFRNHGFALHTTEDGEITDGVQFMVLMFKALLAAEYVKSLKKNVHQGRKGRAEHKGRLLGGYDLYGYTYIPGGKKSPTGGVREINPDTAPHVTLIYDLYTRDRLSLGGVSSHLKSLCVPSPDSHPTWCRTTLLNMLRNPAYTGRTLAFASVTGAETVLLPDATPRLIDDATFLIAQERLAENRVRGGRKGRDYLLSGLIECGECDCMYAGGAVPKRMADGSEVEYHYYRCNHRHPEAHLYARLIPACGNRNVNAKQIDPPVWDYIRSVILDPTIIEREFEARQKEHGPIQDEQDLAIVRGELARNREDEQGLIGYALKFGGNSTTDALIAERQAKIIAERALLATKETDLTGRVEQTALTNAQRHSLMEQCAALAPVIDTLSVAEKNDVMRRLHVRVRIFRDRAEVRGYFPSVVVAYIQD